MCNLFPYLAHIVLWPIIIIAPVLIAASTDLPIYVKRQAVSYIFSVFIATEIIAIVTSANLNQNISNWCCSIAFIYRTGDTTTDFEHEVDAG